MKSAFTMIELIFVIVIIGILAAVAIPKLAATRDDAMVSQAIKNLTICVNDMGAAYTAQGNANVTNNPACQAVTDDACFELDVTALSEGNLTINLGSSTEMWCTEPGGAQATADKQDLNGTHIFGGSRTVR